MADEEDDDALAAEWEAMAGGDDEGGDDGGDGEGVGLGRRLVHLTCLPQLSRPRTITWPLGSRGLC